MRLPDEPDLPPQLNIVPMIDVIFAILTFFIISTLFLTRSEGLPVNLPQAGTAEAQQDTPVTVTIDAQGQIFVNRAAVTVDQIRGVVTDTLGDRESRFVVVNADEQVPHGQVIVVMDELRRLPDVRLGIATRQPDSTP